MVQRLLLFESCGLDGGLYFFKGAHFNLTHAFAADAKTHRKGLPGSLGLLKGDEPEKMRRSRSLSVSHGLFEQ
jgi:hypothetical protein